jgi:hypothetical protein
MEAVFQGQPSWPYRSHEFGRWSEKLSSAIRSVEALATLAVKKASMHLVNRLRLASSATLAQDHGKVSASDAESLFDPAGHGNPCRAPGNAIFIAEHP